RNCCSGVMSRPWCWSCPAAMLTMAAAVRQWGSSLSCRGAAGLTGVRGIRTRRAAMNDSGVTRVAVYIDFDNIVISRYDQVHGRGQFQRDKVRGFDRADGSADPGVADK